MNQIHKHFILTKCGHRPALAIYYASTLNIATEIFQNWQPCCHIVNNADVFLG